MIMRNNILYTTITIRSQPQLVCKIQYIRNAIVIYIAMICHVMPQFTLTMEPKYRTNIFLSLETISNEISNAILHNF